MFEAHIRPYLQKFSEKVLLSRTIRIVGMGESEVEYRLRDYMLSHLNPTVAPYAKQSEVQLRVTASAKTEEQAYALIQPVIEEIQEILGDVVYGIDVENMEQAVVQQLKEKGLKVATAESCTGGLISKQMCIRDRRLSERLPFTLKLAFESERRSISACASSAAFWQMAGKSFSIS